MVGEIVTEEQMVHIIHSDDWFKRTPSNSSSSHTSRSKFGGLLGDISHALRSLVSNQKSAAQRKVDTVSPPWRQAYTPGKQSQEANPTVSPRSTGDDQWLNRNGPWDTNILMLARRGFFYKERQADVRVGRERSLRCDELLLCRGGRKQT